MSCLDSNSNERDVRCCGQEIEDLAAKEGKYDKNQLPFGQCSNKCSL